MHEVRSGLFAGSCVAAVCVLAACSSTPPGDSAESATTASSTAPSEAASAPPSTDAEPDAQPKHIEKKGPWIAYQWIDEGAGELWYMRPDGSHAHAVGVELPGAAEHPDWSPDGRELAVELVNGDGADIWAVNARTLKTRLIVENAAYPAYSHSGNRIAYVDTLHGLEVRTIDLATGDMRTVARSEGVNGVYTPRWSSDDKQIVFELDNEKPGVILGSAIATVPSDGSKPKPRVITDPNMFAAYPDWSPTDDLIVFNTYDLGAFEDTEEASNLYTIRPDGSELRQITHEARDSLRVTQPTWLPDGSAVMVGLDDCTGGPCPNRWVAIVKLDGTIDRVSPASATHPRSQP